MIRMLVIGYCLGIRSERRLCEEVHLNLAYRWFCRLGLEGRVPDHSTFSKNRHGRFRESDLLRRLFETVLARCIKEGLVGGEGFAVDASLIKADANRQKGIHGSAGLPADAVHRATQEYLAVLDNAAFGAATPVVPKFISPADPAARWSGANGGLAFFAYSANYLIDLDHAIIVAIRQAEVTAAKRMIDRTMDRFNLYPARLAGDSGYGSTELLSWLVHDKGIEPHVSVFGTAHRVVFRSSEHASFIPLHRFSCAAAFQPHLNISPFLHSHQSGFVRANGDYSESGNPAHFRLHAFPGPVHWHPGHQGLHALARLLSTDSNPFQASRLFCLVSLRSLTGRLPGWAGCTR